MHTGGVRSFHGLLIVLALVTIVSPALAEKSQPPEGKVALVNGSAITQADFDSELARVMERFQKSGRFLSNPDVMEVKKQVLDSLVARELLYQESHRKGINADQEAVNKQLSALKANEAEFKAALDRMNLSEAEFKSQLERNMSIKELLDSTLAEQIVVSDEEARAFYDSNPQFFKKPEEVQASHILIKVEPQAEESQKDEARKKLEMIQGKLQKGEDFGALAKEFSQGPSREKGGDLGYFGRGRMVKPFDEAAFALQPGEVSGIVETRFGYHLIKVTDKTPETTLAYADIQENLKQHLKQKKLQQELGLYVQSLKEKAKVETYLEAG